MFLNNFIEEFCLLNACYEIVLSCREVDEMPQDERDQENHEDESEYVIQSGDSSEFVIQRDDGGGGGGGGGNERSGGGGGERSGGGAGERSSGEEVGGVGDWTGDDAFLGDAWEKSTYVISAILYELHFLCDILQAAIYWRNSNLDNYDTSLQWR